MKYQYSTVIEDVMMLNQSFHSLPGECMERKCGLILCRDIYINEKFHLLKSVAL